MIPSATELQVVRAEEGWYQVTWVDRDGLKPVRWIKASWGVTTVPPQEHTHLSSPITAPSQETPLPPRPSLSHVEEISLIKTGGVYTLPVEINEVLTLQFILDTGATDVLLPADVVRTLLRTGTIKESDFLPGKTYTLADGSTVNSARFLLRSLKIGNRRVTNVAASIGPVSSALLLGQSFLEKLGTWGMDSQRHVLTLGMQGQRK
jgi:clan AA aspartic protease (TIGR02281 family)